MMRVRLESAVRRLQQPRSLSSLVLRTMVPRALAFLSLASALLVGNAMAVDPLAAPLDQVPATIPSWTVADAATHPGCTPTASWPEGKLADEVVAFSFRDDAASRLAFDRAWALNHNASESDDVWVIGVCP